ncbi:tripartite tricarboxylate transporter TctB family protein [Devosia rhizoryzae]|uniref:Tripartite tricarboxylate transporter TctB family protein n=1 Tax=Devosia rhizoryzae TaxID=2774137 RepID=A0ABX7C958_9HYPH|nr:tripartite tricarboxylate transporter TctB family protein [Devosia rhizoryzae]QQR38501.1 tripartite tricarboxylate transporter TctB family protein [Devosia rhizoryzae]
MKARNYPDIAIGGVFALGGLLVLSQALAIHSMPGLPVGPGLFPTITGGAMAFFGLVLVVQGWLMAPDEEVSLLPEEASGEDAVLFAAPSFFSPFVLGILGSVLASILVMPVLGFLVTGVLFVFAVVLLSGGKLLTAVIFSPIAAFAIYAIFAYGFRVPLPRGILG